MAVNFVIYFFWTKDVVYDKYLLNNSSIEKYNVFLLSDSHGEALKNLTNDFNIFNFSYVGDNYQDMYYKLCYLAPQLNADDLVLITANNHTLSQYRDVSNNSIRNLAYVNMIEDVYDDELNGAFFKSKAFKVIPLFETSYGSFYFESLKNYFKSDYFDNASFGNLSDAVQNISVANRFEQQFSDKETSEKGLFFLNKIIELSKRFEFQIKGIKYPVSKRYYDKIKQYDTGAQNVLFLNNISTIDFQEQLSLSDEMFKDQDHLNKKGAQVFLKALEFRLKNDSVTK
ncbi:hypothetical protein [Psychroserpens sp. MEBiC05023]